MVRRGPTSLAKRHRVFGGMDYRMRLRLRALVWAAALIGALAAGIAPALAQTVNYDLSTTSVMRINLPVSQAVTVVISDAVGKIVSADPAIADAQPITDKSLY